MVETSIIPWDKVDIRELAEVGQYAFYTSEGRNVVGITADGLARWLEKELKYDTKPQCIQVRESGKLVGWLMLFIHDATRIEINPLLLSGHPLVSPHAGVEYVLTKLLDAAKEYARKKGYTRLEFSYGRSGDNDRRSGYFQKTYETAGFNLVADVATMQLRLLGLPVTPKEFPPGYEVTPLFDHDDDALFEIYSKVFSTGQDRLYSTQSEKEQRAYFDSEFSRKRKTVKETTLALLKDKELIGFTLVQPTLGGRNRHLSKIGIHPDYWRQGLGTALLRLVLKKATQKRPRLRDMTLCCELTNQPAFSLFSSHGFKEEFREKEYYWSQKD